MTASPWTPLVLAYELDITILEEARCAYQKAVSILLSAVLDAVRARLPSLPEGIELHAEITSDGADGSLADCQYLWCEFEDAQELKVGLSAWIASGWGGEPGLLRFGVSVEPPPPTLVGKELFALARVLSDTIGPDRPGTPFDPARYTNVQPLPWIRMAEVRLSERPWSEVLAEATDLAVRLLGEVALPALERLQQEAAPLIRAEALLLSFRSTLEEWASTRGVDILPKSSLGSWAKGRFLQVGVFWLVTDPVNRQMVAVSYPKERQVVGLLAARLGRSVFKYGGCDSVVLLTSEELLAPTAAQAVQDAFKAWFDTFRGSSA